MKICRVIHAVYPYKIGGSVIHCHELSNFQSKYGHNVSVLTANNGKPIENVECYYNLKKFYQVKMPWDLIGMENPICPGLWIEILKGDYDLIHAHSHLFFITLFSIIFGKIKNIPSIVTVHGVRAKRDKVTNLLQEIWLKIFSRLIFKMTKKVICLTNNDANEIIKYGAKREKIEIISNGININLFNNGKSNEKYILWVGRYVEEKGLKYLVNAIEKLITEIPDIKVILVGDGPLKPEIIKSIKEKNLVTKFKFINNCSQIEIAKLMSKCEVFVLPSLKEGFPKSLLEAMASRKPVIASRELKDIIENSGIVVRPTNVIELKDAIKQIITNPKIANQLGLNGRKKVEDKWSWNVVCNKIEMSYNEIIH
jgi:glycosyltransferase involved in cell wall biosynthesis